MTARRRKDFEFYALEKYSSIHLAGSWDNYRHLLPLSNLANGNVWRGSFRFHDGTLREGQRYWYYFILDGICRTWDACWPSQIEPSTGMRLNILDVRLAAYQTADFETDVRDFAHAYRAVGNAIVPSQIRSPRPIKPRQVIGVIEDTLMLDETFGPWELYAERGPSTCVG